MKHKTILVTGGAGFVGSNVSIFLKEKYPRADVITLDSLKRRGSEINISRLREHGVRFIHGDIRSKEDMLFKEHLDCVIECSAEPSVLAGFNQNPEYIINTNLSGTINCLELARAHRAAVIFLSTSRVYPYEAINQLKTVELESRFDWKSNQKVPGWSKHGIDAQFTIAGPKTLYGATKLASELILQEYIASFGIQGVINRCGVIAGPWQFGKVDQGIFTYWMLAHYFKKDLSYIGFGGKGKQVRDVLHITDLCELIDLELQRLDEINGSVVSVGGGRDNSLSLAETTSLCERISGNRLNIGRIGETRPGDIRIYITDNRDIKNKLQWSPKLNFETILKDIYIWINKHEKQLKDL